MFVVKDGVAERRAVSLGEPRAPDVEVTAGIAAGEQVVGEGPRWAAGRTEGEGEVTGVRLRVP